jgi:PKD repeat protein
MKQFLKKAKAIVAILILTLCFSGCENSDDNLPVITAGFTHTINPYTGTVTFINTSSDVKYYLWTFGDGTTSTEINPTKTYVDGNYTVVLEIKNVAGASDSYEDTIIIGIVAAPDTVAPVITLVGSPKIDVVVGGTFTDPGTTASDNVDGDVTSRVVVAGDAVNVNKAGTYVITYNVSDASANAATQVTRTVIVTAAGSGGGGGVGADGNLAVNGDFETGNTSGWTTFVDAAGASFRASTTQPKAGSYSGNLVADFSAGNGGAVDAVVKQANMGAGGTSTPNTEYIVSFDLRGSTGEGGDFFVEFFSELSGGGVSKAEIITGKPHITPTAWTKYSYTVRTGSDVSGGITLQLKSSCGPVNGCVVNVFFDNVSVKLK